MPAFHPAFDVLPQEIAVFPLPGALLLPRGRLPLNIFEPRYLAMIEASLAQGRMFGMIQPEPGKASGANGPGLFGVGCLGRLSTFSETEDGRFLITLTGMIRFRVAEELDLGAGGYRRVRADYGAYRDDLQDSSAATFDRAGLFAALRLYARAHAISLNWSAVEKIEDAALVATLGMTCPFAPAEKQALLEALDENERAGLLTTLLEIGARAPDPVNTRPN